MGLMIYIREIKDMYDEVKTWIRMVEGDAEHFSVEMRLRQRSVLSPFLFVLVINKLMRSTQRKIL